MTRVFLSYASADSEKAVQLTRDWRDRGVDVFRFGDPQHQADIIVDEIERQVRVADAFVALMSPAYLASDWCRRESRLALHREHTPTGQFVFVVEAAPTPHDDAGMLGSYSWVDAAGALTPARLDDIALALRLGRGPAGTGVRYPGFRNREDELNKLVGSLKTTGVKDLWVVVSPPLMGKTWLLAKVEETLAAASPPWSVRRLDLRGEPVELRNDPVRLVTALLDVEEGAADRLDEDGLEAIAVAVINRPEPLLFVLDGADLLTPECATAARAAMTAVHHLVRSMGRRARFALVVATRRHDEWRGLGPDPLTGQRFEPLHLTQFTDDVVYQSLLDLQLDIGKAERWAHAVRLQRLSEGLPALLSRCVQWAARTGFRRMAETEGPAVFDAVARDYIQKDLLAADSLLPGGADRVQAALTVLRRMLRVLSTYRLYTQSHLAFHLAEDPPLRDDLAAAGWTAEQLWAALGRTALRSNGEKADEIWNEIEPALRRLLHRYHHPTDAGRSAAHATASRFYSGWGPRIGRPGGSGG